MAIKIILLIVFLANNYTIICKEGLAFKPDKEQNYKIVENFMKYTDTINFVYLPQKSDTLGNHLHKLNKDDSFKIFLYKFKNDFSEGYDFIFDNWELVGISEMNLKDTNTYKISHRIQIKSKKNDIKLQFIFEKNKGEWILYDITTLEPFEYDQMHCFPNNSKGRNR